MSVILEMNGCRLCVVGTECSATLKIVTNPFFKDTLIHGKYMYFAKRYL